MLLFLKKFYFILRHNPSRFFLVILLFFSSCGHEEENQNAFALEKEGRNAEALYIYTEILLADADNFFANKHAGMILSKSNESYLSALSHLEKARNINNTDNEVTLYLFELYLRSGNKKKTRKILKTTAKTAFNTILQQTHECVFGDLTKAKTAIKELEKTITADPLLVKIIAHCKNRTDLK